MKLIKWLLIAIAIVGALFSSLLVIIDPNDYREDIQLQAAKSAGVNLKIEGQIGWSLFPLGINLNQVTLQDQNLNTFTQFENLTLQVDTFSLIRLSPQIHTLLLQGLNVNLVKDEHGQGNWENLIDTSITSTKQPASETPAEQNTPDSSQTKLDFTVNTIHIKDTQLSYKDEQSEQNFNVNSLSLLMQNIAMDKPFPVELSLQVSGSTFKDQQVPINAEGNIMLEPEIKKLTLDNLILSLANLAIKADLELQQNEHEGTAQGKLAIAPFDLNELLKNLGQPIIQTSNPDAFKKIGLTSTVNASNKKLQLNELKIQLDKSNWLGNFTLTNETQAIKLSLQGDSITVDDYLPPVSEQDNAPPAKQNQTASSEHDDLLPLDTIRALDLDIAISQNELEIKNHPFKNIEILFNAKDGVINLKNASTQLFDGVISSTARIDARTDHVKWHKTLDIKELNYLESVDETEVFGWQLGGTGDLNLNADIQTLGNTLAKVKNNAKGNIHFELDKGAITGINMNKLACEGFASINRESITKTDWPNETQFNALSGDIQIKGQTITSPKLILENVGLRVSGKGQADMKAEDLEYHLDISPNGELGDNACRVHDKVKDVAIPILCKGTFITEPAKLCNLDYRRLGRIVEQMAKKEARRKAEKEVDRALDKQLDKVIDKDSELGKSLKDGLKGFFK